MKEVQANQTGEPMSLKSAAAYMAIPLGALAAGYAMDKMAGAAEARGAGAPCLHHVVLPDLDVHRLPAERRLPLPVRRPREVRTHLPPDP